MLWFEGRTKQPEKSFFQIVQLRYGANLEKILAELDSLTIARGLSVISRSLRGFFEGVP